MNETLLILNGILIGMVLSGIITAIILQAFGFFKAESKEKNKF